MKTEIYPDKWVIVEDDKSKRTYKQATLVRCGICIDSDPEGHNITQHYTNEQYLLNCVVPDLFES